jgi:preprotein translocase subunit SecG
VRSLGFAAAETDRDTGPIGPVAVSAILFLIVTSPLMRGGNRHIALIVLEAAALVFLTAVLFGSRHRDASFTAREALLAFLLFSPVWLAVLYLLPIPVTLWSEIAGRSAYADLLKGAGIQHSAWMPLSLVPDATAASLFAGIPVVAAFLAGYATTSRQIKLLLGAFVLLAFAQVIFGLLQTAGGRQSPLLFGAPFGRPFGTFANPNHYANYIAMALAAYIWLAWAQLSDSRARGERMGRRSRSDARWLTIWIAGAVVLVVGVLMSRSRGAALAGLPAALIALVVALTVGARGRSVRTTMLLVAGTLVAGIALVGMDMAVSRFDFERLAIDAPRRAIQAATTMEGAAHFWPWGTGWGTYYWVYPRFQPATLVGTADYAHHDYAQMLFEGGIFAVLLMAAFGWLTVTRAITLIRAGMRRRRLRREEMAAAICGLGLLGFLLHSFVEFNMHIPANAIAASLLAGVYLRPLDREPREGQAEEPSDD